MAGFVVIFYFIKQFFKPFKNFIYLYFWLCWVFLAVQAFSSCGDRGYSSLRCMDLSLQWLLLTEHRSWALRLHASHALQLWHTGLVSAQYVETSWTREQTCVPCRFLTTGPPVTFKINTQRAASLSEMNYSNLPMVSPGGRSLTLFL